MKYRITGTIEQDFQIDIEADSAADAEFMAIVTAKSGCRHGCDQIKFTGQPIITGVDNLGQVLSYEND